MTSRIEWTDETWNPTLGCTRVSEGCRNCYAERFAHRALRAEHSGLTRMVNGHPQWTGEIRLLEERLETPLHWKRARRVFVDSMSDLFHEGVRDSFISRVFAVMALCPQHQFTVLTKRPDRMCDVLTRCERYLPNVILGVSVEDQATADERIPWLLRTPAALRIVSAEPLLGRWNMAETQAACLTADPEFLEKGVWLDGVIVGGESGPGARPMHPDWARGIRLDCQAAGVKFFFKQWGSYAECEPGQRGAEFVPSGTRIDKRFYMRRVGKVRAGRVLDGRTWDEWPTSRPQDG